MLTAIFAFGSIIALVYFTRQWDDEEITGLVVFRYVATCVILVFAVVLFCAGFDTFFDIGDW